MDLVYQIKKNKWFFGIYFLIVSCFLKFLKLFVKPDDHLILFVSYGGRYFNDSPKCIYDAMLSDDRFKHYKLVWAFVRPEQYSLKTSVININSFSYLITALKARCWVTNSAIERGLDFKGKNTFYLYTTHTSFPKTIEKSSIPYLYTIKPKYDCVCSQSEKESEVLISSGLDKSCIILSGYPKNDILCNYSESKRVSLRNKFGYNKDKIVILYAPTFRDEHFGSMKSPVDFKKWEKILGDKYVVLFRAHPVVANETVIDSSTGFVYDVSDYPNNIDLMIVSDILISDYSGIFFEYAVQRKPMFCYAYDFEEYIKNRELNCNVREVLPGGYMDENELLQTIKEGQFEKYQVLWENFRKDYVSEYGHATEICLNKIYDEIN